LYSTTYEEQKPIAEPCLAKVEQQRDGAQDPEEEEILEGYESAEQDIIQVIQSSCFSDIIEEVNVTSILTIFQSGHRFIIDSSFSKIFIRKHERLIEMSDLLVSNQIITKHIGQHIMPSGGTDNASLLQSKLSLLMYSNFISTWVPFVLLYSVYTWSEIRHRCCDYFGFKDSKPRIKNVVETDAGTFDLFWD